LLGPTRGARRKFTYVTNAVYQSSANAVAGRREAREAAALAPNCSFRDAKCSVSDYPRRAWTSVLVPRGGATSGPAREAHRQRAQWVQRECFVQAWRGFGCATLGHPLPPGCLPSGQRLASYASPKGVGRRNVAAKVQEAGVSKSRFGCPATLKSTPFSAKRQNSRERRPRLCSRLGMLNARAGDKPCCA